MMLKELWHGRKPMTDKINVREKTFSRIALKDHIRFISMTNNMAELKNDRCHHCGKRGHSLNECFRKKDGRPPSRPIWGQNIVEWWRDSRAVPENGDQQNI